MPDFTELSPTSAPVAPAKACSTRGNATGRWLGPDGIEYASEGDYRDSWDLLDAACAQLVGHDGARAVVECEQDDAVGRTCGDGNRAQGAESDAMPAPECPDWCTVGADAHADEARPDAGGWLDATSGYCHRTEFDALVDVAQWQSFDGRTPDAPVVLLHAPGGDLTAQDAREVAAALLRAAELVEPGGNALRWIRFEYAAGDGEVGQ